MNGPIDAHPFESAGDALRLFVCGTGID